MQVRVLTLRYSDGLQGFPEDIIKQASAGHDILDVRDQFFVHGGVPHLLLLLTLSDSGNVSPSRNFGEKREDPGKTLPEDKQLLYRQLREWRNDKAKTEGIPSYLILRNVQVAEICQKMPDSLAALKELEGIGEATCKKYGNDIINMLSPIEKEADA